MNLDQKKSSTSVSPSVKWALTTSACFTEELRDLGRHLTSDLAGTPSVLTDANYYYHYRIMRRRRDEAKVSRDMKPYCITGLGFLDIVSLKTKPRNVWGEVPS